MDNSVRPNLRYCIIIIKVKAIAEGSSATDYVTDVRKKEVRQRIM
ncbi:MULTISPECIES: hypothetical protein [unclassified Microcoleus]